MKDWIKKNMSYIISIFLILQPLLDVFTGICVNTFKIDITIGVIIRMIFLACICFICLFVYEKKKLLIPYGIVLIYSIFYLIGMIAFKDSSIFPEIKNLFRVFYFPILLISLFSIKDQIKISNLTLLTVLFLYLIFLFVPVLFGLGYQSYYVAKSGTLGFFNSANEISGVISVITPFMFLIFYQSRKLYPILGLSIMYLVVILMMGTKTPLLALIITIGISMLYLWTKWFERKNYKPIIESLGVILIAIASLVILLPKTNFYKNIKIHLEYLKLNNIVDVFTDGYFIDHFIFSSRLQFLDNKSTIYINSPLYEKLFGIGYINDYKETKLIEMDYFDIYYSHGVIGFIVFFSITLYVLWKVLNDHKNKSYNYLMRFSSLFLIIFLAFFTGHIITAPSVSILAVIILLSLSKREKKDLLFTAYNLDIGGIEKALLNLVNRIDYSKYNVEIVLEEKKGVFLNRVNKEVLVRELKVSNHKDALLRKAINYGRKLYFKILNFHRYDFSCCYATYSYSGSKLALMSSSNTALYVHSDFRTVYPNDDDFYYFFDSRNVRDYNNIIFVSNENKKGFIEKYKDLKDKCLVFNNFVDTQDIRNQSIENIKGKSKDKILFTFVGRLEDTAKKVSRQINLVKEIPNIELWIIGDGPDRNKYEEEVKEKHLEDRITFFGSKENPFPYMKEADYIILTSDYEGFPVTYLEAITLGKQIITTIPRSDDSIDMNKISFIVSKDEDEMVKEVKEIIKNKEKKPEIDLEELQEKRMNKLMEIFNL